MRFHAPASASSWNGALSPSILISPPPVEFTLIDTSSSGSATEPETEPEPAAETGVVWSAGRSEMVNEPPFPGSCKGRWASRSNCGAGAWA